MVLESKSYFPCSWTVGLLIKSQDTNSLTSEKKLLWKQKHCFKKLSNMDKEIPGKIKTGKSLQDKCNKTKAIKGVIIITI